MTTNFSKVNVTASPSDEELTAEMAYEFHVMIGVYLLVTGVFGGVGNMLAVVMFVMDRQLSSSMDLLLLNLAIADVGMCGMCFPVVAASSFAGRWLFGEGGCTAYGFLGFMFGNTALCTLTAISVQRYLVICKRRSNVLGGTTVKILLFTWAQAILWSTLPLTLPQPYAPEPFGTSCSVSWASPERYTRIYIYSIVSWFLLHFMILTGCYINIYVTSRIRCSSVSSRSHRDLLVSKICFVLVVIFVICWAPYCVFSLWLGSTSIRVPLVVTAIPVMLAKLSSCINPVLYIVVSQRFRNKYLTLLMCNVKGRSAAHAHAYAPRPTGEPCPHHLVEASQTSVQHFTMLDAASPVEAANESMDTAQ